MATATATRRRAGPSPARVYLVASGVFLVVLSTVGFALSRTFPIGSADALATHSRHIFGIFETNGWHNLAGMMSGIAALTFALRPEWSRFGALLKGWIYVVVTLSIAVFGPETFWIASNTADQIVHGSLAVFGLATGYLTPKE